MTSVIGSVVLTAALLHCPACESCGGSYLIKYVPGPDGIWRPQAVLYTPQPGDLVFFDDHSRKWGFLYWMVGSGPPFHSGIVVARPDGSPAVLEAGPDDTLNVRILDALPRLQGFKGTIWIRQLRQPLSEQQRRDLTEFAMLQDGKRYALGRLLLQATPIRCRGKLRCLLFGKTYLDRSSWLCCELAVAAGTVCGLFDPSVHHANSLYPRDIIFDRRVDLSGTFHEAACWCRDANTFPEQLTPR